MDKIVMIEAGGNEIPDEVMLNGIIAAHNAIKPVIELINQMVEEDRQAEVHIRARFLQRGALCASWLTTTTKT